MPHRLVRAAQDPPPFVSNQEQAKRSESVLVMRAGQTREMQRAPVVPQLQRGQALQQGLDAWGQMFQQMKMLLPVSEAQSQRKPVHQLDDRFVAAKFSLSPNKKFLVPVKRYERI